MQRTSAHRALRQAMAGGLIAACAWAAACGAGTAESEPASRPAATDTNGPPRDPPASAPAINLQSTVPFDYRVLAREGNPEFVHEATWSRSIALTRSRYYFLKVDLRFEVVDEAAAACFDRASPRFIALSECIEMVFRLQRTSDLQGPAAMERRREELIRELNKFFGATVIRDAVFENYMLGVR